jgi:hypothetical protein
MGLVSRFLWIITGGFKPLINLAVSTSGGAAKNAGFAGSPEGASNPILSAIQSGCSSPSRPSRDNLTRILLVSYFVRVDLAL